MRIPTVRQVESALKRYAGQLLAAVLGSLGIFFRDRLVNAVAQVRIDVLSQGLVWLAIALVVAIVLLAFYYYRFRVLEKAVLQFDPQYYEHAEFNKAFKDATRGS